MSIYTISWFDNACYIYAHSEFEAKMIFVKTYPHIMKDDRIIYEKYYNTYKLFDKLCQKYCNCEARGSGISYYYAYEQFKIAISITDEGDIAMVNAIADEIRKKGHTKKFAKTLVQTERSLLEYMRLMDTDFISVSKAPPKIIYRITTITIKYILKKCQNNYYHHIWRLLI